jgi:hypothetical protein
VGEALQAEGKLAHGPDFGVLNGHICQYMFNTFITSAIQRTGFKFFLISVSRVPAFRAMIGGAASGSWAMGEPHSEQKMRWTGFPELPLLA